MNSVVKMMSFLSCLVLVLTGCAVAPIEDGKIVKSSVSGVIAIPVADRKTGLYVEVADSQESTEILRAALKEKGYTIDQTDATAAYHLKVTPVFVGPASDRPKVGESENNPVRNESIANMLVRVFAPSPAMGLAGGLAGGLTKLTYWIDTAGKASGADRAFDDFVLGRRTRKPQEAIVTVLELTHGASIQKAEVLTESYAETLPLVMMWADNLRMAVWFLE
jgi:hypothetical protein